MEKMLYMANIFYIWSSGVSSGSVSRSKMAVDGQVIYRQSCYFC
jgi:hypothetical protein